ncbi:hypothetical protein ACLNGM_11250 [Aureimonas phyllosphaerae]|uniref:hypothetical protein n=1 Tax=Aureimonas phyllosphaerae TaxID=1166078 RepID=UPI003A5BC514
MTRIPTLPHFKRMGADGATLLQQLWWEIAIEITALSNPDDGFDVPDSRGEIRRRLKLARRRYGRLEALARKAGMLLECDPIPFQQVKPRIRVPCVTRPCSAQTTE